MQGRRGEAEARFADWGQGETDAIRLRRGLGIGFELGLERNNYFNTLSGQRTLILGPKNFDPMRTYAVSPMSLATTVGPWHPLLEQKCAIESGEKKNTGLLVWSLNWRFLSVPHQSHARATCFAMFYRFGVAQN